MAVVPKPETAAVDALVRRALSGDADAFGDLFRLYVDLVFTGALRLCADVSVAEDLTQRAFLLAWEKRASFRGEAAFATWVHRIAVNLAVDHHRKVRRARPESIAPDDVSVSPGLRLDLERAIAALPEGARQVVVLHDVEGWQHAEIADAMGISVGTSKSQLHRARTLLKKALSS